MKHTLLGITALLLVLVIVLSGALAFMVFSPDAPAILSDAPASLRQVSTEAQGAAAAPVAAAQATATPVAEDEATPAAGFSITIQAGADTESSILEAVYLKVSPSVVKIVSLSAGRSSRLGIIPSGQGSGFVWDTQGHIVTNEHVVNGSDGLQVSFPDGTTLEATVVGIDADSGLAVIRVDPTLVDLIPVERGNMDELTVGERAIAIGNPFGFEGTMTTGIVSALGRSIPATTGFSIPQAIQTDAAINPGNSGGPLLNSLGEVIGVNAQIESSTGSNSGIGFAIPVSIVERVVPALIQDGSYRHAYLGMTGGTYSRAWAEALGLPEDAQGAYVHAVVNGGPAAQAGLRAGDVDTDILLSVTLQGQPVYLQRGGDLITAVDGQPVTKMDDLLVWLAEEGTPGDDVEFSVLRAGGEEVTVTVTLGERPARLQS